MVNAEYPTQTEAKEILAKLDALEKRVGELADALNSLGVNVQWVIDNAKSVFQMFQSPQFMQMIPGIMGGMVSHDSEG